MSTSIADLAGTWTLSAYGELTLDDAPTGWLIEPPTRLPDTTPNSGVTLTIADQGRFTESGRPTEQALFHSYDGVLGDANDLFDGYLAAVDGQDGRVFVYSDEVAPVGCMRVDDGDTAITDEVRLDGPSLLRVVSVVTDGVYASRYLYRYGRD
ncbi:MAG: hypothetical protein ACK4UY_04650 [Dietzia sp.]